MRVQEDRYPIYRRRNDGSEILIPRRGAGTTDPLAPDCYDPCRLGYYSQQVTLLPYLVSLRDSEFLIPNGKPRVYLLG